MIDSPLVNFFNIEDINLVFTPKDLNNILLSKTNTKQKLLTKNFYKKINKNLFSNEIERLNNFVK